MNAIVPVEFNVEGHKYRAERLNAFDQQTIAAKLGGVFLMMGDMRKVAPDKKSVGAEDFIRGYAALLGDLRKPDVDLATMLCLSAVSRLQQGDAGWAKITTSGAPGQPPQIAFDDIDLRPMLLIVWHVLQQHRILDFFFGNDPR